MEFEKAENCLYVKTQYPLSHVIPVNCRIDFNGKAPFTHRFQITGKFGDIKRKCNCWCFHSCSFFWPRDFILDNFNPNYTVWKCIICIRMLWLAQSRWRLNFNGSGLARSRRLTSARSYVLKPLIFILWSHTAEFWQFTGNVTTRDATNVWQPKWFSRK